MESFTVKISINMPKTTEELVFCHHDETGKLIAITHGNNGHATLYPIGEPMTRTQRSSFYDVATVTGQRHTD